MKHIFNAVRVSENVMNETLNNGNVLVLSEWEYAKPYVQSTNGAQERSNSRYDHAKGQAITTMHDPHLSSNTI